MKTQIRQQTRVIATAFVEREGQLLLAQLARGKFAGFWLLPSVTVENGTVTAAARGMLPERTGYRVIEQQLISVLEEPLQDTLVLRFVFRMTADESSDEIEDKDILRSAWFSHDAVRELLAERDAVPNLGVLSLLRAWAEETPLRSLEILVEDALCPCGSGYRFKGCCGWDAR